MAAANNLAVAAEVWRGAIPVCFRSGDERPMYAMVPRLAYLPMLHGRLTRHFQRDRVDEAASDVVGQGDQAPSLEVSQYFAAVSPARSAGDAAEAGPASAGARGGEALWFTDGASGAPVAWELPLGAAHDAALLRGPVRLPWKLVAHFGGAPADHVPCDGPGECFRAFFHSLKQAVHLDRGTARAALAMPRVDQEALWKALDEGDRSAFAARDLAPSDAPRNVPVRVLFREGPLLQIPMAPSDATAGARSLADALAPPVRAKLGADLGDVVVTAHGVPLPWDLPLLDAWRNLHYGDRFLYLAVDRAPA